MSRHYTIEDKTIALAGVFQATKLVHGIARKGMANSLWLTTASSSLLQMNPDSVIDVFGDVNCIASGLRTLVTQLNDSENRNLEITTYVITLLKLEQVLSKDTAKLAALGKDIDIIKERTTDFDLTDNTLYTQLARVYQDHISTLNPKIMVKGEPLHLENPDNAAKVRMALLAGIRAAMLWKQCGGSKWSLLFKRKQFVNVANDLLNRSSI